MVLNIFKKSSIRQKPKLSRSDKDELLHKLNIIKGELEIGNYSDGLKTELYEILKKLGINENVIREYMKKNN